MLVEQLDHVVIHIDDWDAAHHFYLDVLGLERVENSEVGARGWGTSVYCNDPSGNGIEFICYTDAGRGA